MSRIGEVSGPAGQKSNTDPHHGDHSQDDAESCPQARSSWLPGDADRRESSLSTIEVLSLLLRRNPPSVGCPRLLAWSRVRRRPDALCRPHGAILGPAPLRPSRLRCSRHAHVIPLSLLIPLRLRAPPTCCNPRGSWHKAPAAPSTSTTPGCRDPHQPP